MYFVLIRNHMLNTHEIAKKNYPMQNFTYLLDNEDLFFISRSKFKIIIAISIRNLVREIV